MMPGANPTNRVSVSLRGVCATRELRVREAKIIVPIVCLVGRCVDLGICLHKKKKKNPAFYVFFSFFQKLANVLRMVTPSSSDIENITPSPLNITCSDLTLL